MLKAYNPSSAANDDRMHSSSSAGQRPQGALAQTQLIVPIRSIGPSQRPRILEHLIALDADDRYLRFGYAATDEQIAKYVAGIDFNRDDVFGVYNRKLELIAVAHLALADRTGCESCAEFGVSVARRARGRGYGTRLFERAAMHARNERRELIFIQALSENAPMISIARRAGAVVERFGSESEAYLRLTRASFDSRLSEAVYQGFAETDYRLKEQAKRFHDFVFAMRRNKSAGRAP